MRVVMATEGTYPFVGGGVSTWCHQLCENVRGMDFSIFAVTGGPRVKPCYRVPPAVKSVRMLPLWPEGAVEPYLDVHAWSRVLRRRWRTTPSAIRRAWLPPLQTVLREVFSGGTPADELVDAFVALAAFTRAHDYRAAMRSRETWGAVLTALREHALRDGDAPTVADASLCARWLFHLLLPLAVTLPPATVFHATIAASCALPGVVARRVEGTRFALTEHGVYLRERYIAVSRGDESRAVKRFQIGVATAIGRACYATADVIAPVATFNTRWEVPWEAPRSRVRVIYNGVDTQHFRPRPAPPRARPTVAVAARVFPLKDIETLIRASAVARAALPDLEVRVYGSLDADPPYVARCRALLDALDLRACVRLMGFHPEPEQIYGEGDISVLSSISEGFPYTVLESMASGVPCVGTDVGGVREAIADTGIVVAPRSPEALGAAMAELLGDRDRREALGARARDRVERCFTLERQVRSYEALYASLASVTGAPEVAA